MEKVCQVISENTLSLDKDLHPTTQMLCALFLNGQSVSDQCLDEDLHPTMQMHPSEWKKCARRYLKTQL